MGVDKERLLLPDFVHIRALLVQVQGHGCVNVEVEHGIGAVTRRTNGYN